jgi:hypothetical protein
LTVTRYRRPVAGVDLLHAPEMRLLHPAERQSTTLTKVYDEGIGCGLDNGSPDAYADGVHPV